MGMIYKKQNYVERAEERAPETDQKDVFINEDTNIIIKTMNDRLTACKL